MMRMAQRGFIAVLAVFFESMYAGSAFLLRKTTATNRDGMPVLSDLTGLDYVPWTLCGKTYHSNLGGLGPDDGERSLRFYSVATFGDKTIDLVITNTSEYIANNILGNGIAGGEDQVGANPCFGVVNIAASVTDLYDVSFAAQFYWSGTTDSVALDHAYFSLFDLDNSKKVREWLTIDGFANKWVHEDTELRVSGNTFAATEFGRGSDNPSDPLNLTEAQKKRAVSVDYYSTSGWTFSFHVAPFEAGKYNSAGGRNIIFSSVSALVPVQSPATVPDAPQCSDNTCKIIEDPHITVFDGAQISLMGIMRTRDQEQAHERNEVLFRDAIKSGADMWLVKSESVSIQARYWRDDDKEFVQSVAIGGPILNGNTLIVGPITGKVLWNNFEILKSQTSEFSIEGLVHAKRHLNSHHVEDCSKENPGIDIDLPSGVQLTINRQPKYLNVLIRMVNGRRGSQDGLCGNFNGNPADDALELILRRDQKVKPEDSLYAYLSEGELSQVANAAVGI